MGVRNRQPVRVAPLVRPDPHASLKLKPFLKLRFGGRTTDDVRLGDHEGNPILCGNNSFQSEIILEGKIAPNQVLDLILEIPSMAEMRGLGDFEDTTAALSEKDLMFKPAFEEFGPFNQPAEFSREKEFAGFFSPL